MDLDRNDVEELTEISSEYGKKRLNDERLNELRFEYLHKPCNAKKREPMYLNCIMQNKESSLPKWNTLPFVKTNAWS
jgi:hypothetical protein